MFSAVRAAALRLQSASIEMESGRSVGFALLASLSIACSAIAGERDPDPTRPPVRLDSSTTAPDSNAQDIDSPEVAAGIDFGEVGCGVDSAPKSITIVNKTNSPRPYTMVLENGSAFQPLDPKAVSGTVPVGQPLVIKMIAAPTFAGASKSNVVIASGSSFVQVPLVVTGAGGALEWETSSADLGEAPLGNAVSTTVKLRNTGTRAATIDGFGGQSGDITAAAAMPTIAKGDEAEVTLTLTAGGAESSVLSAMITPQAKGLCAQPPAIAVSGKRVNTTVTVSGADWGKKPCTTTPSETHDVVVKNYWNKPITWSVSATSIFTLAGRMSTGTLAAKDANGPAVANITFRAPALGADPKPLVEAVTVTLHGANGATLPQPADGDHVVNLSVDVRGAVLAITPATLNFVATTRTADQQSFRVANTGNEVAWLMWKYQRTAGGPAWAGVPQETGTNAGGTTTIRITYEPTTAPPNAATLTPIDDSGYMGGGRVCNPNALTAVTLSGSDRSD